MTDDNFIWLFKWYYGQCDGDWEHGNGIKIGTIDNPGWYLRINLNETELQNKQFQTITVDRSEHDWIDCFIKNNVFEGVGGPLNLPEILQIFRDWAENIQIAGEAIQMPLYSVPVQLESADEYEDMHSIDEVLEGNNTLIFKNKKCEMGSVILNWVQEWVVQHCNRDWEYAQILTILMNKNNEWNVKIDLYGTELEYKKFFPVNLSNNDINWLSCEVKDKQFQGNSSTMNLLEILKIFRDWAESRESVNEVTQKPLYSDSLDPEQTGECDYIHPIGKVLEQDTRLISKNSQCKMDSDILNWIQEWIMQNCSRDEKHVQYFSIRMISDPGWSLVIDLRGTGLEEKKFSPVNYLNNNSDWLSSGVKDEQFYGGVSANNLVKLLNIFRIWVEN